MLRRPVETAAGTCLSVRFELNLGLGVVLPRLNGYFIKSDNTLRGEVCKKEENTVENTN